MKKVSFVSVLLLVFLFAGLLGYKKISPFPEIYQSLVALQQEILKQIFKSPIGLKPRVYLKEGVQIYHPEQMSSGLTFIQGWFSDGVKVKVINENGEVVHQWHIDYFDIWKSPPHNIAASALPRSRFDFHSQGMHVFANGDLLVNISQVGIVKFNQCGEVLWKKPYLTHHSIHVDNNGHIWVPANTAVEDLSSEYWFDYFEDDVISHKAGSVYENNVLELNPEGEILRKYSILEALINAGFEHQLFDSLNISPDNPTHLNDVKLVTKALALRIPKAKEGDLLVSLRNMHSLLILSRETGNIIWHKEGPWVRQHDPEINKQGKLTVYNNRSRLLQRLGDRPYSNIIEFDPLENSYKVLFPKESDQSAFFSSFMGSHQLLVNGNILITESTRGRVFEINPQGETVWEYVENYNTSNAAMFSESIRYPRNYFSVSGWVCE